MAKKSTTTRSKAVVGSTRASKSFRLTRKRALFALFTILVFSVAAGLGWENYGGGSPKAEASSSWAKH